MKNFLVSFLLLISVTCSGQKIIVNGHKFSNTVPTVIADGNTVAWYRADQTATITKDVSQKVSAWNDYLGSGRNLTAPNADATPTWSASGITFNGVFNYMSATFTLAQPEITYIVIQLFADSPDYGTMFCGATSGANCPVYANNISTVATVTLEAGGGAISAGNFPVGQFNVLRVVANGAGSKVQINNLAANTGNPGTNPLAGFTLGSNYGIDYVGSFSHIQVKEVILRKIVDSSPDEAAIYAYLKNKYGL